MDTAPLGGGGPLWSAEPRPWLNRPRRRALSALFLVYLLYVGLAVAQYSHGVGEAAGYVVLGAFCADYLLIADRGPELGDRGFGLLWGIGLALMAAELVFARAVGFTMCLHLTAAIVGRYGRRAWPAVVVFILASLLLPLAIPAWHDNLLDDIDYVTPIAVPIIALASLGLSQVTRSNLALSQARSEVARLSAETERTRIARDLHDLLGHSLTTITVKAGLAHRLGAVDPERALQEIAEVEGLARRSLGDVRAAVANYREVTLTGELATGRELLRAAAIAADLPSAVDVVDPAHHELFGWVVREGLTNVVRHSRASSCTVRLARASVEILDDGVGGRAGAGSGLSGLRERVDAAGGVLEVGPRQPGGWRLRVGLNGESAA